MVPKSWVVFVATEEETGTCRANVAGGFISRNHDSVLVSRDLADVVSLSAIFDSHPSAPHKPARLVLRARQKDKFSKCNNP